MLVFNFFFFLIFGSQLSTHFNMTSSTSQFLAERMSLEKRLFLAVHFCGICQEHCNSEFLELFSFRPRKNEMYQTVEITCCLRAEFVLAPNLTRN